MKGIVSDAFENIVMPAVRDAAQKATQQAAQYAVKQGPEMVKQQAFKATGAENTGDLVKQGVGKVGDSISDSGGITGIAGKLMSKLGGGKGGGSATGYGAKRRMPIQQDVFVSVALDDAYKAWTEYKRWTEFMHRANLVDPQVEEGDDGGSFQLSVTEKMWGFKRPFRSEVVSQKPSEHIRWKSTEGTKHVGVIAFHGIAPRLTLVSVNIDHAPSGPIEKIARGARFDKRAIRADLHRFKGWVEHKSPEEIEEMEGWLGTVDDGQVTITHEDALDAREQENGDGQEGVGDSGQEVQDGEGASQGRGRSARSGQEGGEGGQEGEQEGEEDDQEVEPEAQEREVPDPTEMEPEEPEDEEGLGEGQPESDDTEEEDEEGEEEEPEAEDRPLPTPSRRGGGRRQAEPEAEEENGDEEEEPDEDEEEEPFEDEQESEPEPEPAHAEEEEPAPARKKKPRRRAAANS